MYSISVMKTAKFRDHVSFKEEPTGVVGQAGGEGFVRHYTVAGKPAGFMYFSRHPSGMHVVEHSRITDDSFKGLGLGKKMYGDLVRDKGKVMSDIDHGTSQEATRVWDSMKRRGDAAGRGQRAAAMKNPGLFGTGQSAVVGGGKQPIHVAVNHKNNIGQATNEAKRISGRHWMLNRGVAGSTITGTALGAALAGKGNRSQGTMYGLGGALLGGGFGATAGDAIARRFGLNQNVAKSIGYMLGANSGGALGGGAVRGTAALERKAIEKWKSHQQKRAK